jgi:hypothetical protein
LSKYATKSAAKLLRLQEINGAPCFMGPNLGSLFHEVPPSYGPL